MMQEQTPEAVEAYMMGANRKPEVPRQRRKRGERSVVDCNSSAKLGSNGSCMKDRAVAKRPSSVKQVKVEDDPA